MYELVSEYLKMLDITIESVIPVHSSLQNTQGSKLDRGEHFVYQNHWYVECSSHIEINRNSQSVSDKTREYCDGKAKSCSSQ